MIDLDSFHTWVASIVSGWLCWAGYVNHQLRERPTRDEVLLRQHVNDIIQEDIKSDLAEIKEDVKEIRSLLNAKKRNT